jgi:ubiquinone/menaquinone biosynthesis C-methylase UbiE
MDIGPGMGFFSLPMAKLVGNKGKVFCIDLQDQMIAALIKRAKKLGLDGRIEPRVCTINSLMVNDIKEKIDFVLAFAVIHEVPDPKRLLTEIIEALKPDGKFLIAEPAGHVSINDFNNTVQLAEQIGFHIISKPKISRSNAIILSK